MCLHVSQCEGVPANEAVDASRAESNLSVMTLMAALEMYIRCGNNPCRQCAEGNLLYIIIHV